MKAALANRVGLHLSERRGRKTCRGNKGNRTKFRLADHSVFS
jgi:hypothetical protein